MSPIPRLITRQRAALFARADQYAKEILVATVTNSGAHEAVDEALYALMRQSSYWGREAISDQIESAVTDRLLR